MSIHMNSRLAYDEERIRLSKRAKDCLMVIEVAGPVTDREVLAGLDLPDMNCVRPRITELCKLGLVIECGRVKCSVTNKSVRQVKIREESDNQMEMPL